MGRGSKPPRQLQRLSPDGKRAFAAAQKAQEQTRYGMSKEATKILVRGIVEDVGAKPDGWTERVNRSREGC